MIRLQGCVPAVLAEAIRRQPLTPAKVAFAWRRAVGSAIARVSDVSMAEPGTLVVRVKDRHWARELRRMTPLILQRLEPLLGPGAITTLVVQVAPEP